MKHEFELASSHERFVGMNANGMSEWMGIEKADEW